MQELGDANIMELLLTDTPKIRTSTVMLSCSVCGLENILCIFNNPLN